MFASLLSTEFGGIWKESSNSDLTTNVVRPLVTQLVSQLGKPSKNKPKWLTVAILSQGLQRETGEKD